MNAIAHDRALRGILASNLLTVALALWQDWPLVLLLWPYWCQSVIIGWFARRRMLALQGFSSIGSTIDGHPAAPATPARIDTADFFALHYGGFHLVYLVFLLAFTAIMITATLAPGLVSAPPGMLEQAASLRFYDPLLILGLVAGFWFSHRASHHEHLAADLRHAPSPGKLMFLPYLRVLPMHLTILLAIPLAGAWGVALFGALRTVADVAMHEVEHRWLQNPPPADAAPPTGN